MENSKLHFRTNLNIIDLRLRTPHNRGKKFNSVKLAKEKLEVVKGILVNFKKLEPTTKVITPTEEQSQIIRKKYKVELVKARASMQRNHAYTAY